MRSSGGVEIEGKVECFKVPSNVGNLSDEVRRAFEFRVGPEVDSSLTQTLCQKHACSSRRVFIVPPDGLQPGAKRRSRGE